MIFQLKKLIMSFELPVVVTDEWANDELALVCCAHLLNHLRRKCTNIKFTLSDKPFGLLGNPSEMLRFQIASPKTLTHMEVRYSFKNGKGYLASRGQIIAKNLDEFIEFIKKI